MLNDLLGDKLSFEYGNHHVSHGCPTHASAIFHWGERQFMASPRFLQEVNNCFLENNFCYWVSGCYFFCERICHQWPYLTNKLQAVFSWKIVVFFTRKCTFHFVCMSFFSDMLIYKYHNMIKHWECSADKAWFSTAEYYTEVKWRSSSWWWDNQPPIPLLFDRGLQPRGLDPVREHSLKPQQRFQTGPSTSRPPETPATAQSQTTGGNRQRLGLFLVQLCDAE